MWKVNKMNNIQYPVAEVIPHSPPMVLLDKVLSRSDDELTAEIVISNESRFFDHKLSGIPTWVGIEYMAQAIAALAGSRAKDLNQEIKLGFLLGTRKYHILEKIFLNGETYQIKVKQLYMDDSGLASFDCSINLDEQVIVKARLNVFEADDAKQILES